MKIVTNKNFIPFSKISRPYDTKKVPDIVKYPDLFSGEIAEKMIKHLSQLHYSTTQYCIANKLCTSPRKMLWFTDDPNWTYVFSRNHMFGLEANEFPIFLRCIQFGVQRITGRKFNSCLVNIYESGDDNIAWHDDDDKWLGENFIVPSVSFGDVRRFQLRSKQDHKKKILTYTENGSMIVMRESVQKYWQHNVPKESGRRGVRFNLTFRNVHPELVDKMPKARTKCNGK